ncbi:sensor histidine kinase [bacterium 1xD8-48]|nr:sensor histidine kinase [bacterium 1xD8-48]
MSISAVCGNGSKIMQTLKLSQFVVWDIRWWTNMDNQKSSEPIQLRQTKKWKKCPKRLSVMFSLLTFLTLTLTIIFSALLTLLLIRTGILVRQNRGIVFFVIALVSVLVGTIISNYAGRHPLTAIIAMSNAAQEVARGNFDVSLDENIKIKELRDMAHNFNLMTKELAGTEILRTDFVENVSHEFKTPLSAIEGYATLLQKKDLSEEKRQGYTKKILYNTRRLSTLTSNILLLSRLDNQEIGIKKESFCLDEQLREILLLLEDGWTEKKLELEIDLDAVDYYGNKDLLAHVWQNILSNAIKFSPEHGIIHILLRRENGSLITSITDNGIGMSEDIMRRVFEKFYQGDLSRSSQGNGLGLALAKRIVNLHGGDISVSSKEGKGTTFTVSLPLALNTKGYDV